MRYRWLLPAGHTVLDLLLLALLIWQGSALSQRERSPVRPLAFQEGVDWDPVYDVPPSPTFMLMATGAMPAGVFSLAVRPRAGVQNLRVAWDPLWMAIHEAIAIPFWFLIGMGIDTGRMRSRTMRYYLLARAGLVALAVTTGVAQFGAMLQTLFWIWMACYVVVTGTRRVAARLTAGVAGKTVFL